MDELPIQFESDDYTFIRLVTGLYGYLANRETMPSNLRRALNAIALKQRRAFPKTLEAFIRECHRPLCDWYPLEVPEMFTSSQPILVENRLGVEAETFCIDISEQLDLRSYSADIPQTALDNLAMIDLLKRLRQQGDASAQRLYVDVRSLLVEQSCFTGRDLRLLRLDVYEEIRKLVEDVLLPAHHHLPICDRCGLLEWRDGDWHGIKPEYCSNHTENAGLIQWIANEGGFMRLRRGIHLRTFLPGRAERELFAFAEEMCDQFPEQLQKVERYPGLDTYDLRLTFADAVWAIDVKDHASADSFIKQVKALYNAGDLHHDRAFYVIPDTRLEEPYYADVVEKKSKQLPRNLDILSVATFQQAVQHHVKELTRPVRKSKRKGA